MSSSIDNRLLVATPNAGAPAFVGRDSVALVVAHPDGETLFASYVLSHATIRVVWHVTDGSPYDPSLRSAPLPRTAYARLRRKELLASLRQVNLGPRSVRSLGGVDQEAVRSLVSLTERLRAGLLRIVPRVLITHAYEGGHPDHDAAAFVSWAACASLRRDGLAAPQLWEMASYHAAAGHLVKGEFIRSSVSSEYVITLDEEQKCRKRNMLECFTTQAQVIAELRSDTERLRRAPSYDFGRPPHPRPLHYETLSWPLPFEQFEQATRAATRALGLRATS